MATTSSEVYDLFMQVVTDYRLIDLFNLSETDFETYLEAWLLFSINEFDICDQDLTYSDGSFSETITTENKLILATLMMKYWLQKDVNDITQFRLHITDRDFKVASEALNLREKTAYFNIIKEQCSQMLNNYEFKKLDWDSWRNQEFEGD